MEKMERQNIDRKAGWNYLLRMASCYKWKIYSLIFSGPAAAAVYGTI
jgi:hypothetical protein